MKKRYIGPATDIVEINLRYSILDMSASEVGGEGTNNPGGSYGGTTPDDDDDLSREDNNNRNSVWDNIW